MTAVRATAMLVAAILFATVAALSPQVNFPFNSQFPPTARTEEAYSFQFASTTFQPDSDTLQYSLIGSPSWLSLNSKNRTLWGIPTTGDAGMVTFTIAAAGEAGAVANMESKLFVEDHDAPKARGNISQTLASAGQLSGPKSLTLLPSKPFEIKFPSDVFQTTGKSLSYHATLADHTPLPAWASFDAPSLRLAGTTPPLTSLPQPYEILLIASEIPDFAAASISFTLLISNHQLLFKPLQQTLNLTKGNNINISDLRGKLFLDNAPIQDENIQSATAELPSWLSFNNQTFGITGIPPSGLMSQDLSITIKDQYGDTATHSIRLLFNSRLFTGEIGRLNITAGEYFEYVVPRSLLTKDNEDISVDFGPLAKWFQFNATNLTIHGKVAEDFAPQDIQGSLTAKSIDDETKDSQSFDFHVSGAGTHVYPGSSIVHPSANSDTSKAQGHQQKRKREAVIIGSVLGTTIGLAILLACGVLLCRRRKRQLKGYISPKDSRRPRSRRKTDISRPIPMDDEWEDVGKTTDADLEKGDGDDTASERTPERPSLLGLQLPSKKNTSRHAATTSIDESETKILTAFDRSSWGFKDEAGPSHHPHDSMKIPTQIARRDSDNSSLPTKNRRRTTAMCRDPYRSSGLPVNRRLTGLGHGRHTHSPSRNNNNFTAYRRPMSFNSYSTRSTSFQSTVPSAFPTAPTTRHTTQLTTPMEKRRSIRLVAASTCESLVDRRTIDEKRKSYIRKRASAQSPFFGASSSRVSSSSYKLPPGLINELERGSRGALSPLTSNTVVKPSEDTVQRTKRELPDSLRIRKPSETPTVESPPLFTGSLRKPPKERSFTQRHTVSVATNRGRAQQHERPGSAAYTRHPPGRRSSTRHSVRAQELKSSLNSLTGSRIFEDAEMSESVYSTEEEDIEEYEKRQTVKANHFTLPPLKLSGLKKSKIGSKRDSKREINRTSQREPTPYSLALEHGGKENRSSTYSLNKPATSKAKGKAKVTAVSPSPSPERPKTAIGQRQTRPAYHSRTESRTTNRSSTQRHSQTRPLSRQLSNKSRHSRKSQHLRSQSRQSSTKHGRDHSRSQSSAYPWFDASTLPPPSSIHISKTDKENNGSAVSQKDSIVSFPRDPSGNIIDYALHEDPMIEELASSSIGIRTSNGRISASARASRLAQLHSHPVSKRDTTIGPKSPAHTPSHSASIGLGLSLLGSNLGGTDETPGPESERGRERTPLSILDDGNGASPERERLRVVEGKAKRPVSVEIGEAQRGRSTWGSLKAVMGRERGWTSREEKEMEMEKDRETKAFL
ncbi:hypothetical protein K505DRAFT_374436 [Melanomma pulvis-pyrius CBS 109.77]|uniref:Dystroglycan-type cadherin-like domain-containing protein n=1 Tax=Melanomma pulvis-pyrius CBS 109.77 TaxID=1314802 RepID=A0A6A6XE85_9PLEO|nr:hypothetical protein K505DRAFT_374436 [Melanomma pulvis-pyrius CBS 109.77]